MAAVAAEKRRWLKTEEIYTGHDLALYSGGVAPANPEPLLLRGCPGVRRATLQFRTSRPAPRENPPFP